MLEPEVREPGLSIPGPDHVEPVGLVTDHHDVTRHGVGQRGRRPVHAVDMGPLAGSFQTAPSQTHVELSPPPPGRPTSTTVPSVGSPAMVALQWVVWRRVSLRRFRPGGPDPEPGLTCPRRCRRSSARRGPFPRVWTRRWWLAQAGSLSGERAQHVVGGSTPLHSTPTCGRRPALTACPVRSPAQGAPLSDPRPCPARSRGH